MHQPAPRADRLRHSRCDSAGDARALCGTQSDGSTRTQGDGGTGPGECTKKLPPRKNLGITGFRMTHHVDGNDFAVNHRLQNQIAVIGFFGIKEFVGSINPPQSL